MKRSPVANVWQTPHDDGLETFLVGTVVHVPAGSNSCIVRLSNTAQRTIRNVVIAKGLALYNGDRVLIVHTQQDPKWIAVTSILDTSEHGGSSSETGGEYELHAPSNLTVTGAIGLVIAEWDAFTGNTVCWEVEHNDTASDSGSTKLYTRGSYFLYPSETAVERFVRARAVRYDVASNTAYYSSVTPWTSATSIAVADAVEPTYSILIYSGGTSVSEFDVDDAGFATALTAVGAGDTIWIPPGAFQDDYSIPANVSVVGVSTPDVIFSGELALNSGVTIETLTVSRSKSDADTYYGVVGPDDGTAYARSCVISAAQAGGGAAYGISVYGMGGALRIYGGRVEGTTADARVN